MAKVCKYYTEQQLISYDCGESWVQQDNFRKGSLYEVNSEDCGFMLIYRWALSPGDYECISIRKYDMEVLQYTTEQGGEYQNVYPEYKRRTSTPSDYLSVDCGYVESTGGFKFSGTSVVNCGNRYSTGYTTEYLSQDEIRGKIAPHSIVGDCTEVIGVHAFCGSTVEQVDISSYVKKIEEWAFARCSGLTDITIPDSVEDINGRVFYESNNLSGVTLPSGLTYIADELFYNTNITDIALPSTIKLIGNSAFGKFSGETPLNISLPQTLTDLGYGVFGGRTLPSGFTLPNSVKYISSFDMPVDGLELPPYLEHLGGISGIPCREGLVVPGTVKLSYGCDGAVLSEGTEMGGCKDLPNSINFASGGFNEFACYIRPTGFYATGESIFPPNVQVVDSYRSSPGGAIFTFKSQIPPLVSLPSNTACVFVPDNSVELYKAMWDDFEQYIYPLSYKQYEWRQMSIGDGYECVGVDKHYIEHKFISLDSGQTWYDTCLSRVGALYEANSVYCGYVPQNSILTLRYNDGKPDYSIACDNSTVPVNSGDTTIKAVAIGECARTIPRRCFSECIGITTVNIQNGLTEIDGGAFSGCSALTSINIPSSVTTIYDSMFDGGRPFNGCNSLPVVDHIRYADTYLVGVDKSSITRCTIKDGTKWIGGGAFRESHIYEITIPNSVIRISDQVFYGCSSLRDVVMHSGLKEIGYSAFASCTSLGSVTIPDSITKIESGAFMDCRYLRSITINAIVPPTLEGGAFDNTNNCPLYVPSGSVSTYKAASGWSSYASRIQAK